LKRQANPPMRALKIKPESACPLYCQLYDQLRQAILEQRLPAGTRLPSTRTLARTLGVSRNTVLNAYEALIADALLVARKGSGHARRHAGPVARDADPEPVRFVGHSSPSPLGAWVMSSSRTRVTTTIRHDTPIPRRKKSNAAVIAIIVLLALAFLVSRTNQRGFQRARPASVAH
jgi:hypothetical protein